MELLISTPAHAIISYLLGYTLELLPLILVYILTFTGTIPDLSAFPDGRTFLYRKTPKSWKWYKKLHFSKDAVYKKYEKTIYIILAVIFFTWGIHVLIDRFTHDPKTHKWNWLGWTLEVIIDGSALAMVYFWLK